MISIIILGIIIGYASLTLKRIKGDERLASNLKSIESAAQRGVALVKQLLVFARKQERILRVVSVNNVIMDIYKMIAETFPKVISINCDLSSDSQLVYGDETELHQAILNLSVNARDAMIDRNDGVPRGGILSIGTSTVDGESVRSAHSSAISRRYVRLMVSDTGKGMDEATQKRVFEPFFTTKERGKAPASGCRQSTE